MSEWLQSGDMVVSSAQSLPIGDAKRHALEIVQPGRTNKDIVHERCVEDRRADIGAVSGSQLRDANWNLITAIFVALDSCAATEVKNQRQTEFLSMLAHELRNPLHSVSMANDLIGNIEGAHQDLPKLRAIIGRQVAHLVRLVDDLLDVSRINTGKIALQRSCIAAQEVIESALEISLPLIRMRQQSLELDFPDRPIYMDGDRIRLVQVFSNLMLNASKYTPECGHLIVRVTPRQREVEFAVIDDGAGVPIDIQPHIFELFVQGPRPQDPAQCGLGIGLSLVRMIVQLHGGTVCVHSSGSGTGSQFLVTIPMAAVPPETG